MSKYPSAKGLTIAQQAVGLRGLFPQGDLHSTTNRLTWEGDLRPGVGSRTYTVRIEYELGSPPKAWVVAPDLREFVGDRKIPHLYDQEAIEVCVYLPKARKREWHSGRSLARTFVLWVVDWLWHFEVWEYTDEWEGGGVHPETRASETDVICKPPIVNK